MTAKKDSPLEKLDLKERKSVVDSSFFWKTVGHPCVHFTLISSVKCTGLLGIIAPEKENQKEDIERKTRISLSWLTLMNANVATVWNLIDSSAPFIDFTVLHLKQTWRSFESSAAHSRSNHIQIRNGCFYYHRSSGDTRESKEGGKKVSRSKLPFNLSIQNFTIWFRLR